MICENKGCENEITPKLRDGGMDKRHCSAKCRFAAWANVNRPKKPRKKK